MKIVRQQAYCCVHMENEISTFAFIYINTLHTLPSKKVPTYIFYCQILVSQFCLRSWYWNQTSSFQKT